MCIECVNWLSSMFTFSYHWNATFGSFWTYLFMVFACLHYNSLFLLILFHSLCRSAHMLYSLFRSIHSLYRLFSIHICLLFVFIGDWKSIIFLLNSIDLLFCLIFVASGFKFLSFSHSQHISLLEHLKVIDKKWAETMKRKKNVVLEWSWKQKISIYYLIVGFFSWLQVNSSSGLLTPFERKLPFFWF